MGTHTCRTTYRLLLRPPNTSSKIIIRAKKMMSNSKQITIFNKRAITFSMDMTIFNSEKLKHKNLKRGNRMMKFRIIRTSKAFLYQERDAWPSTMSSLRCSHPKPRNIVWPRWESQRQVLNKKLLHPYTKKENLNKKIKMVWTKMKRLPLI